MLNGAPTFISLVGGLARPHEVRIELPTAWKTSATALMPVGGQATPTAPRTSTRWWTARSSSATRSCVSSPSPASGTHLVFEGDTAPLRRRSRHRRHAEDCRGRRAGDGRPLRLPALLLPQHDRGQRAAASSTRTASSAWPAASRPAHGAPTSASSASSPTSTSTTGTSSGCARSSSAPSTTRTRVYTKALWIAEGFTDYYAGLLVKRAGLSTRDEFFEELTGQIEAVQTTPGRLVTSVDMASFDTWIKQYRPDENTPNTTINYYPKGRRHRVPARRAHSRATTGAKSLDDAMRLAYERYSGAKGYTLDQFYQTMSETAGVEPAALVRHDRGIAPRSWTTTKRSTGSGSASARSTRATSAPGWARRRATTPAGWWSRRSAATRPRTRPA